MVAASRIGQVAIEDESGFDFISLEADVLDARVGERFGTLFLAIGTVSLFAAALGGLYFTVVWVAVVAAAYAAGLA